MKPEWLKKAFRETDEMKSVVGLLADLGLNTVCREADCPNYAECFTNKTATIMILGAHCTRNCRFCNVTHAASQPVDPDEPTRVGEAIARLQLSYIVITSVTRDDLPDGGAEHFAQTIGEIRRQSPGTAIETLIPDFLGDIASLEKVIDAKPDVISHNMETVEELYDTVRPQADYHRSLEMLERIGRLGAGTIHSKSGIMLGLGETEAQLTRLFDDLRAVNCEFLTIGQYFAPSPQHLPVVEYVTPERFDRLGDLARKKGFSFVASAPFVRSSYHAGEAMGR
jgi:lipoic acid synthetase